MKKTSYLVVILLSFAVFSVVVATTTLYNIKGYSWSSEGTSGMGYPLGTGWVKADPVNGGVYMNNAGTLSGYAWANPRFVPSGAISNSNNIGWLSFNQASGCPTGTCTPKVTSTTTVSMVTGWARFIANDQSYTGWVHLSGTTGNGLPYGVTYDPSSKTLSGWAWGDKVIGWIHVSYSIEGYCEVPLPPGAPTGLAASVSSCTTVNLSWNPVFGSPPVSGYNIYRSVDGGPSTYVFSSVNPYIPDNTVSGGHTYTYTVAAYILGACQTLEGPQSNAANATTPSTCNPAPPPALSLKCVPANVTKGQPASIAWTVSTGGTCTITSTDTKFPSTFSVPSGGSIGSTTTSPVNQTRDYSLSCTNSGGTLTTTTKGTCYVSAEYQHF